MSGKPVGLARPCGVLLFFAAVAAQPAVGPVAASEIVAAEVGVAVGIERTTLARAGILSAWRGELLQGAAWRVRGYWELSLGRWQGDAAVLDGGVTPILRWEAKSPGALGAPYAEAGVGVHLLSRVSVFDRSFSTAFQFGEHGGLGTRLGDHGRFDLSYKLQHLSNGGIRKPNDGMLFHLVRVGYAF